MEEAVRGGGLHQRADAAFVFKNRGGGLFESLMGTRKER